MRYYVNMYDKELAKYKDLDITLVKIMDKWGEKPPIFVSQEDGDYICTILNNTIEWDINELLCSDKAKKLTTKIIERRFTIFSDMETQVIVNKDKCNCLIKLCDQYTNYSLDELHNIVKNTLDVDKEKVKQISRCYYFYEVDKKYRMLMCGGIGG